MIAAATLWELVERRAALTPDALFVVDESDRELSFAGYRDAALRAAAGLFRRGIAAETPVSWMLPTTLEALVLAGALCRLGAVQNPILPIYRERETRFITRQTRARLLCVPPPFRGFDYPALARDLQAERGEQGGRLESRPTRSPQGREAAAQRGEAERSVGPREGGQASEGGPLPGLDVLVVDDSLPDADPDALPPLPRAVVASGAPVRWIFYTSGTTSDPKGARHTDSSLIAAFSGLVRVLELRPDDRHGLVFPVTHVGGIGWLIAGLQAGFAHVAVAIFDPERSIALLARHGVTQAGAGTAFHQAYLAAQRRQPATPLFGRVRAFPGGGAPKPPQLHFDLKSELGGVGIVSGYGLTECPIIAMNSVRDQDAKLAYTEGRMNPPETEVRVVRPGGARAAPGEEGELRVKGPQLFRGYLDASLDADAFDADGFFCTGDLGRLDADGYVVITGRLKDVIIRKGENISAKELEDLLYNHPKVADVAVVGLPDPLLGERCCAVVACRGEALRFEEMVEFLEGHALARQKIPEQLEIVDAVPRNAAGKLQKQLLRERYA